MGLSSRDRSEGPSSSGSEGHHFVEDGITSEEVSASASSSFIDGRITPTASSSTNSNLPSPNPTTISLLSQTTQSTNSAQPSFSANVSHPAEIGLGNLQSEEQLKTALQSKDRMFLLVLAKEFEAFINRISTGQILSAPTSAQVIAPTSSTMAALGASTNIGVTPTSKFQRMLVYKTAEWYGLKAVPGLDGQMVVGVLGTFNDRSVHLKLSELVPAAPSPTQKFRIMQRTPVSNGLGADRSSPADGSNGDGRGSKWKTYEEREAEYQAAREKIYGSSSDIGDDQADGPSTQAQPNKEQTSNRATFVEDEVDPVPRQLYSNGGAITPFEVVYPSLYHPPKVEQQAPPPTASIPAPAQSNLYPTQPNANYGYPSGYAVHYPQQVDLNGYPIPSGYPPQYSLQQQQQQHQQQQQPTYGVAPQGYVDGAQAYMIPPGSGFATQGWQQAPIQPPNGSYQGRQPMPTGGHPYMVSPNQQNGLDSQAWQYPQQAVQNSSQTMPMIPQGVPYPNTYGYHPQHPQIPHHPPPPPIPQQRQGTYAHLVQPTPMRPQIHPHSSASSSISSRSYQDGSRPHSRGSTTSTRSAASSVRLGAMYPVSQGPGYRQKAMKGQGLNGLTSLGLGSENKNRTRGHSPSSATTTSSRSSRRANSIQLAPPAPGQHQLPQRPDWAANNVPYHPSPMPLPSQGSQTPSGPSAAEFPPLLRQGQGTNAEPMQVERAKMKATNGTVWNGAAVKTIQHNSQVHPSPASPRIAIIPGPPRTPGPGSVQSAIVPLAPQAQYQVQVDIDPDFPRRVPAKTAPTLYDPSGPRSTGAITASAASSISPSVPSLNNSRPSSVNTNGDRAAYDQARAGTASPALAVSTDMSAEDIIEAKLAAVSINAGVSIGPPPSRQAGASYAKIVRRD
ncbi:hypothetical protein I317_05891 [Kwoniella heveanensis CBS 569]|nr:hypothetical protein I317_05891 [Kwoniella heveanensis CBS 569]